MLTLKKVNQLAKAYNLELVKGNGYFYFISNDIDLYKLSSTSVYVNNINQLSILEWVNEMENINNQLIYIKNNK